MLKRKLKECKSCGLDKVIWKDGKCADCCKPSFKTLKNNPFPIKSMKSQLKKTRRSNKGNKEFFEEAHKQFQDSPVSFESGKNLGELGTVNMAHLMPKEFYKSVAHDIDNIILLSWDEHTRFDDLLFSLEFEKLEIEFRSWSKICERFKLIIPKCTEEGRLKRALEEYLSID